MKRHAMLVLFAVCVGCGGEPAQTVDPPARDATPPPPAGAAAAPAPSDEQPADDVKGQPVEAGIGAKSKRLEGGGYLPSTLRAIPFAEESVQFAQAQRALQLYKAANEGQGPATHEEYMEKIVKENMIQLPELPAGHEYRYDPETEQLMDVEIGNH
jgi:hypothetical protein